MELCMTFISEFCKTFIAISPYLILGFFTAGLLYAFIPNSLIKKHLGSRGIIGICKATVIGVPLPLCSCGVIPVAMSLQKNGASKGATTSFLIATPQIGIDSIIVTWNILGPLMGIFRPLVAFISGVIGGIAVDTFAEDNEEKQRVIIQETEKKSFCQRCVSVFSYGFITLAQDIGRPLIVGLFISAVISVLIPQNFFEHALLQGIWGMFAMLCISIPIYVCSTGSIPIVAALMLKGISPGMALIFLMTGPATNAATIATIWKVQGKRVAFIYLVSVILTALGSGLLLDQIYEFVPTSMQFPTHSMDGNNLFYQISAIFLFLIFIFGFVWYRFLKKKKNITQNDVLTYIVQGMHCSHCANSVIKLVSSLDGVSNIQVDLPTGKVIVAGTIVNGNDIIKSIESLGYTCSKKE